MTTFRSKLIIIVILLLTIKSYSQEFKFIWLNSPEIGVGNNYEKFDTFIESINEMEDLKFAIITGNLTSNGKNEDIDRIYDSLEKIKIPYYILSGTNDINLSESGGSYILDLWQKDKFFFTQDSVLFMGLNSSLPFNSKYQHYKTEDLNWLKVKLDSLKPKHEIFLFTNTNPIDSIDNGNEILNLLANYDVQLLFSSSGKTNEVTNIQNIPLVTSSTIVYQKNKELNFFIVENSLDSIKANIFIKPDSLKQTYSIEKKENSGFKYTESQPFVDESVTIIIDTVYHKTMLHEPIIWEKQFYTSSYSGMVSCYDSSGTEIWNYNTYGNIVSKPVLTDGILVVGTTQGDLLTLNALNGRLLQSIGFDDAITSQLITIDYEGNHEFMMEKTSGSNSAVVLGTSSGVMFCYDLETLEELWRNDDAKGIIETKPLVLGNKIIYGSWDGNLYAIDARKGWLIWKWKTKLSKKNPPAAVEPISDGNRVFISTPDGFVYAIDARLGKTLWQTDKYDAFNSIGLSNDKKKIYIKAEKDKFHVIHARNGKFIKKINVDFGIDKSSNNLIEIDEIIPFGADNGNVYRINNRYYYKTLLFLGNSRIHSIQKFNKEYLLASNMDGRIIIFKVD